jgi:putative ABC transport system permease protein
MNFIKRAGLSLIHNARNNILLILLFSVLATLILTGLCVWSATEQSSANVRRELGGEVMLYPSDTSISKVISLGAAEKVSKLQHVKSSNFVSRSTAHAVDFNVVTSPTFKGALPEADCTLKGMTDSKNLYNFSSGSFKLIQGRNLSDADTGKPYAIIEQTLAERDSLEPGDSITVASAVGGNNVKLTIVGVYQNVTFPGGTTDDPAQDWGNMLLVPYKVVSGVTGKTDLTEADFYIDDPAYIDSFRAAVAKLGLPDYKNDVLDAQDALYERIAGPLSSLSLISFIMVVGLMAAGTVILSLIVVFNLRGRKHEIGVLLSVGERKSRIIAQMALEILVPVLIAFSLSIAAGQISAQSIGSTMYSGELSAQSFASSGQSGAVIHDDSTGKGYTQVHKIDVSITPGNMAELYLAGIALALISAAVPLILVMRYQPKDILIQIE